VLDGHGLPLPIRVDAEGVEWQFWGTPWVSILCKVFIMLGLALDFIDKVFVFRYFSCKVLQIKGLGEEKCPGPLPGHFLSSLYSV
jgi:hypothetical protein